jgi:tetratricopeptide (TPR) repeat protein
LAKKTDSTPKAPTNKSADEIIKTNISGGININADNVDVTGDIVGRDKIVEEQHATGRNIIQIGSLNIPIAPLLVAVAAGLVVLIFIGLRLNSIQSQLPGVTPTPSKMQRDFNIAVSQFGQLGADNKVQPTDESRRLSQAVYDTLTAERDAFPEPQIKAAIEIRYGELPITNGLVLNEDDAALVADRIGADMIIYGSLDPAGGLTPQFYVSPQVRAEVDALLTGNHRVGAQPIPMTANASFNGLTDLRTRASALFYIAVGLTYDVFGRAARALEIYQQAEQSLKDWPEHGAGKEILYFFKGQAALFQAQQVTGQAANDLVTEAAAAFQKAIDSNPDYARAYVGLGSTDYVLIQRAPLLTQTLGSPQMTAMFAAYDRVPDLARRSGDKLAEAVGLYSQGLALYQKGHAQLYDHQLDAAGQSFAQAIALISPTLQSFTELQQPRLIAQAYLGLGAIYHQQALLQTQRGDVIGRRAAYENAQRAFSQCLQVGQSSQDRILIDLIVKGRCQPEYDKIVKEASGG